MSTDATQNAITGPDSGEASAPPVLITEQEVRFATAAAVALRSAPITRRLIDMLRLAIGVAASAFAASAVVVVNCITRTTPARQRYRPDLTGP